MQDLPMEDLQKIGLVKDGQLLLDEDDLNALSAGRRTDMLRLENLAIDGLNISLLDAKLSLRPNREGKPELMLHPIYRKPEVPEFLTDTQAEMLEKGEVPNLQKMIFDGEGNPREVLIEFDKDTNEFIITDTEKILEPDMINDIPLTAEQKERYRKGKEVETGDGTTIQYSGTEKQGIRSDKLALIASVLIDGGVSYVVYKGLNYLFGKKAEKGNAHTVGRNYNEALKQMQNAGATQHHTAFQPGNADDYSETLSR
ncbi:MAG: hypothetical protein JWQ66_4491 [Mucilaginibacter sp.]|nr:hypothetical protein [Mucilaginibacter sp.]